MSKQGKKIIDPYEKFGWRQNYENWLLETNLEIIAICWNVIKKHIKDWKNLDLSREDLQLVKSIKKTSTMIVETLAPENRRQIPLGKRFKILKRNNFTCQYCWRSAPDVILHVDHIIPFSKWWKTEDSNLQTACIECNLWKSNKLLNA